MTPAITEPINAVINTLLENRWNVHFTCTCPDFKNNSQGTESYILEGEKQSLLRQKAFKPENQLVYGNILMGIKANTRGIVSGLKWLQKAMITFNNMNDDQLYSSF